MKHATLEVLSGEYQGSAFPLIYRRVTLGSAPDNHIPLSSYDRVAAHHAEILWDGSTFRIEDKSGQGIGANGVLVPAAPLVGGSVVQIGDFRARLQLPAALEFADLISPPSRVSSTSAPNSVTSSHVRAVSPGARRSEREQRWAVIGGLAFGAAAVTVFMLLAQFTASPVVRDSRPLDVGGEPDTSGITLSEMNQSLENSQRASCQSNLKQVALAVAQYQQDYDEKFPLIADEADPTYYGWADSLQPYLRSVEIFQCPSEPNASSDDPRENGYTDYFFNTQLSAEKQDEVGEMATLVLMGDGGSSRGRYNSNGCNANDDWPVSSCDTAEAASIPDGGATRHLNGGNYAFADGHVKWLSGETNDVCLAIGNSLDSSREYSFGFTYTRNNYDAQE
jgi:prepilin-type processing-associated H-X9-DG protein